MIKINGKEQLNRNLQKLQGKHKTDVNVIVGYTQSYAVYVHEAVGMVLKGQPRTGKKSSGKYWDPQGRAQAKFLEEPFRKISKDLVGIVGIAIKGGATFLQGMLLAGLRLQRESQLLVPVDTGLLKASAFTRKEK